MTSNSSTLSNVTEIGVPTYRIYFMIFQGIVAIPIIFGNLLILISWMKFKILRKRSNILVANLALTDLLVGLIMIPYQICGYAIPQMFTNEYLCILSYTFYTLFLLTSITTLLAISVERYIAIAHPLYRLKHITGKRIGVIIAMMWIMNSGFCVAPMLGWNKWQPGVPCVIHIVLSRNFRFILYAFIFLCVILNLVLYTRVTIYIVRRFFRPSDGNRPNDLSGSVNMSANSTRANGNHTKVMMIVLGLFLVCWLPFLCVATTETVLGQSIPGLVVTKIVFLGTGIANSGLNWIIYGWMNSIFRNCFRTLMCIGNRSNTTSNFSNRSNSGIPVRSSLSTELKDLSEPHSNVAFHL